MKNYVRTDYIEYARENKIARTTYLFDKEFMHIYTLKIIEVLLHADLATLSEMKTVMYNNYVNI